MFETLLAINISTILLSSITLFFHRNKLSNFIFIFLFLVLISLVVIVRSAVYFDSPDWILAIVFANFSPFYFLLGPLFFLHVRTYLTVNRSLKRLDALHLVPFVLQFINLSPYLMIPFEQKLEIAQNIQNDMLFIQNLDITIIFSYQLTSFFPAILVLIYVIFSIYKLLLNYSTVYNQKTKNVKLNARTHIWLIYIGLVVILIAASNLILNYNLGFVVDQAQLKPFAIIQSVLLISIPISLVLTPQVMYGLGINKKINERPKNLSIQIVPSESEIVIVKPLSDRIQEVLQKEKPFLQSDFALDDLVSLLNVPKYHVYNCLNVEMNIKFTDLRSHYRVQHAKKLLVTMDRRNMTIEAVGMESGFSTRSSFYRAFKNDTDLTPSEFVEINRNQNKN